MFESSDKKEASWVFAMFLMSEFSQTAQAVGGGHLIPTVKTIAESEAVQAVPNMSTYLNSLRELYPVPHLRHGRKFQINSL